MLEEVDENEDEGDGEVTTVFTNWFIIPAPVAKEGAWFTLAEEIMTLLAALELKI